MSGTLAAVWKLIPIWAPHNVQLPMPSLDTGQSSYLAVNTASIGITSAMIGKNSRLSVPKIGRRAKKGSQCRDDGRCNEEERIGGHCPSQRKRVTQPTTQRHAVTEIGARHAMNAISRATHDPHQNGRSKQQRHANAPDGQRRVPVMGMEFLPFHALMLGTLRVPGAEMIKACLTLICAETVQNQKIPRKFTPLFPCDNSP